MSAWISSAPCRLPSAEIRIEWVQGTLNSIRGACFRGLKRNLSNFQLPSYGQVSLGKKKRCVWEKGDKVSRARESTCFLAVLESKEMECFTNAQSFVYTVGRKGVELFLLYMLRDQVVLSAYAAALIGSPSPGSRGMGKDSQEKGISRV